MHKTFMNKARRDACFKAMPKENQTHHRKTSMRNQLLHPMYVDDYELETGIKLTSEDKGFGNGIYQTYFKVLYEVREQYY